MSEQRDALAEALFDAAFPGEREKDPYWYQAYEHDWYAQTDRLLASEPLARLLADAEQRGAAQGWEEGWRLGVERKPGRNPYRTALTPAAAQENA